MWWALLSMLSITANFVPALKDEIKTLEIEEKREIWTNKPETNMEERGLAIWELSHIYKEISQLKLSDPQKYYTVIHFDPDQVFLLDLIRI